GALEQLGREVERAGADVGVGRGAQALVGDEDRRRARVALPLDEELRDLDASAWVHGLEEVRRPLPSILLLQVLEARLREVAREEAAREAEPRVRAHGDRAPR